MPLGGRPAFGRIGNTPCDNAGRVETPTNRSAKRGRPGYDLETLLRLAVDRALDGLFAEVAAADAVAGVAFDGLRLCRRDA